LSSVSHKPLFGKKGKLLNLGNLDFEFVSDFDIRISDFANLATPTFVESPLQIRPFLCKTNPIFQKVKCL